MKSWYSPLCAAHREEARDGIDHARRAVCPVCMSVVTVDHEITPGRLTAHRPHPELPECEYSVAWCCPGCLDGLNVRSCLTCEGRGWLLPTIAQTGVAVVLDPDIRFRDEETL